jgi:uncharacterized pyridoxamine 5'-phosphate oxidase family protein
MATKLLMTRQGAKYLIKQLVNKNKIEFKIKDKEGNYVYGLR